MTAITLAKIERSMKNREIMREVRCVGRAWGVWRAFPLRGVRLAKSLRLWWGQQPFLGGDRRARSRALEAIDDHAVFGLEAGVDGDDRFHAAAGRCGRTRFGRSRV